jgi:hypothetical protein
MASNMAAVGDSYFLSLLEVIMLTLLLTFLFLHEPSTTAVSSSTAGGICLLMNDII